MPYDPTLAASTARGEREERDDAAAAEDANPFLQFVDPQRYRELVKRAAGSTEAGRFISPLRVVNKLRLVGALADETDEDGEVEAAADDEAPAAIETAPAAKPWPAAPIAPRGTAGASNGFARNLRSIVAARANRAL